jgi:protease-4
MEWTNYGDLLTWAKMKPEVIHAGSLKDAGDPSHAITPEERVYFQGLVDNMYGQFVTDVANGRHLPADQVKALATGQVWTGQQALPLHLIDKAGRLPRRAARHRQIGRHHRRAQRGQAFHVASQNYLGPDLQCRRPCPPADGKLIERRPGFYFLWR